MFYILFSLVNKSNITKNPIGWVIFNIKKNFGKSVNFCRVHHSFLYIGVVNVIDTLKAV